MRRVSYIMAQTRENGLPFPIHDKRRRDAQSLRYHKLNQPQGHPARSHWPSRPKHHRFISSPFEYTSGSHRTEITPIAPFSGKAYRIFAYMENDPDMTFFITKVAFNYAEARSVMELARDQETGEDADAITVKCYAQGRHRWWQLHVWEVPDKWL